MEILNELEYPESQIGRLALIEGFPPEVYVVWDVSAPDVSLVELDRPHDVIMMEFSLEDKLVYLLEPLEVLENVTEWGR